jgi:hypothetical protein
MRNEQKHTFISYTVRDGYINYDILGRVKTYFENFGSSFIDLLDNDSQLKQERIITEIEKAHSFVLLKTPQVMNSPWVLKEIDKAKSLCLPINSLEIEEIEKITATNNVYTK